MNTGKYIPRPLPFTAPPYQSGIADPRYPLNAPDEFPSDKNYDQYRGRVDIQDFMATIRADVLTDQREELELLLKILSAYAKEAMEKKPSKNAVPSLEHGKIPESYRVTVTIAFGVSLFRDASGHDRFGICHLKPKNLKLPPHFPGDSFKAGERASDLLLVVASDHPYVNVAISRYIAEYINASFWKQRPASNGKVVFKVRDIQQGFGRPDRREFLRFNDGIDNLRSGIDLENLVFVDESCREPAWCVGGSYLVYRKIREHMPRWESHSTEEQEGFIGRKKDTSEPLSREKEGIEGLTPVYPDPTDTRDGPLTAHIRKVQPRRKEPDLFGVPDLDRRFLRRGYPFFEGVDEHGNAFNGLHFFAYMKSIQQQFEHVTNMWQMNPDFPVPGTGIDAMYAKGFLETIDGGYYFCPPAPYAENDFVGSGLFRKQEEIPYKMPAHIYGFGITFVDIDETVFKTIAKIRVLKDGEVVRTLTNAEFNEYTLQEGESYDFGEFKSSTLFLDGSQPIIKIVNLLKRMLNIIQNKSAGSRIVFLTARSDFDDKEQFLNAFRKFGIDIDSSRMYVERSGNLTSGTVAERKKTIVMRYLESAQYRRVRLIDDNMTNLKEFLTIQHELPEELLERIRINHGLATKDGVINFFAYHVNSEGEMKLIQ